MSGSPSFVRASRLYDAHHNQRIPWDWLNDRPLRESYEISQLDEPTGSDQAEVDAAIPAVSEGQ